MITEAWTPLRFHDQQARLWRTRSRYVAVAAGRGSGKTELARRRVVRFLPVRKPWPNPIYVYALPTSAQAHRVAWREIKKLVPRHWIAGEPKESSMTIETIFGSELRVVGMDKPHRIEGDQIDGIVLDESCDQKPTAFNLTVSPMLTHRDGWCWRIGVPKRYGIGAKDFKSFFDAGMRGEDNIESYTWPSSSVLTPDQLAWVRKRLDARDFAEQFEASWEDASGLIFHAFSNENIKSVEYNPDLPLVVGSDFNVDPMCWVVCQQVGDAIHQLDEIFLRNANTQLTMQALFLRWGKHQGGIKFYGDASGRARKTSASLTDYLIIKNFDGFFKKTVHYPKANPARADRFAACNALMCTADETRRYFVHPRCVHTIADLTSRAYVEGTREPNDKGDIGHITDALGYIIHWLFPIKLRLLHKPGIYLDV
jgi:hypothetical protein